MGVGELVKRERAHGGTPSDAVVADLSPDPIGVLSTRGRWVIWNQAAIRRFGYSLPELNHQATPPFVPADQLERFQRMLRRAIGGEAVGPRLLALCTADGTALQTNVRMIPTSATPARNLEIVVSLTPADGRPSSRQDDAEKAVLLRELDHRVRNQLSGLQFLVGAEKLALSHSAQHVESAIHALDRLAGRIAAQLAAHEALSPSGYGRVQIDLLVRKVAAAVVAAFSQGEIRIEFDCENELPYLDGQQGMMLALILNELVANACQHGFANRQGGLLRVSCRRDGEAVVVGIQDDGPGASALETSRHGLILVEELAARGLSGQFQMRNVAPRGTLATVRFVPPASDSGAADPLRPILRRYYAPTALSQAMAAALAAGPDQHAILKAVADQLNLSGLGVGIALLDRNGKTLTFQEHRRVAGDYVPPGAIAQPNGQPIRFPVDALPGYAAAVQHGQTLFRLGEEDSILTLKAGGDATAMHRITERLADRRRVIVPLRAGGRTFGVLSIFSADLTEDDVPSVRAFADQTAILLAEADARLRASRNREWLQAILEGSGEAIVAITEKSRVLLWNSAAEQLFGYSAQEARGKLLTDLIMAGEDREQFQAIVRAKPPTDVVRRVETFRSTKTGERIPVLVTIRRVADIAGAIRGYSLVYQDLRPIRHAMENRDLMLRLTATLDNYPDALAAFEVSTGKVLLWNAAAARLFGYEFAELAARGEVGALLPGDKMAEREECLQRIRLGEPIIQLDTVRLHRNGQRVPVLATFSPLLGLDGRTVAALAAYRARDGNMDNTL